MDSSKEAIRIVFDSFDKDYSGFIDFKEIVLVSKELGQQISEAEVKKIFKDIDTNKDQKISFDEFFTWWQYGRDNKLETLVALQLKALNLLSKAKHHYHKISSDIVGSSADLLSYNVRVALGSPENTKTAFNVKTLLGSNQNEFASQITKGLNIGNDVPAIIFRFKSSNPIEAKDKLEQLVENALDMGQAMIPDEQVTQMLDLVNTSFGVDGDNVVFGITIDHPLVMGLLEQYLQVINLFVDAESKVDLDVDFGLNFDINTFFDNKEKKISDILGKGFHLNAGLKISENLKSKYSLVLNKAGSLLEKSEYKGIQFINKTAFLFLLKSFNLEFIAKDLEDLSIKSAGTPLQNLLPHVIGPSLEHLKQQVPPLSVLAADMPIIQDFIDYAKLCDGEGSFTVQIPRISVSLGWKSLGGGKLLDFLME